jgi:hypothetical protein
METKVTYRDGDGDGRIEDGTPRERPATPTVQPPRTWRRRSGGYVSSDREWLLDRMTRMAGGNTNGWAIMRRVPADRVARDNGPAYDTRSGETLTEHDGVFYAYDGDATSFAEAREYVDPPAAPTVEEYRQAGRDAVAKQMEGRTPDQGRAALANLEARLATATDEPTRESLVGAIAYLTEHYGEPNRLARVTAAASEAGRLAAPEPDGGGTPDDDPDREAVYAAEAALPEYDRMKAITDADAAKIATDALGEQVTILRTEHSLGGLEKGRHIFGVWLPSGPVIAVPPDYPLSPFEVYHETAHLMTSRGAHLTGHGKEFQEAYLAIADERVADRLRPRFPAVDGHDAETGPAPGHVRIENLTKVDGFDRVYEGTVAEGSAPVWRHIGNRRELSVPAELGWDGWNAAQGGFTVRQMEGDTQFAATREQAMAWEHPQRNTSNGYHYLVSADVSGLPVRFIARPEGYTLAGSEFRPNFTDHGNGTADLAPDTTAGLGVVGDVPVDRIRSVEFFRPEGPGIHDGKVTKHFESFADYATWFNRSRWFESHAQYERWVEGGRPRRADGTPDTDGFPNGR